MFRFMVSFTSCVGEAVGWAPKCKARIIIGPLSWEYPPNLGLYSTLSIADLNHE